MEGLFEGDSGREWFLTESGRLGGCMDICSFPGEVKAFLKYNAFLCE